MATLITSIATVGATAANTACRPSRGKVDAYLKDSKTLKYTVSNEYICAELGRFIGLPIPPSGLCYKQGHDPEHFFASLNFNLCNSVLPPIDPADCVRHLGFESAGVVLFDMLIANGDRHRNNINLDTSQTPPRLTVFDHGHALFGSVNGGGSARLNNLRDNFVIVSPRRHCLLDSINNDGHFGEWIDRIRNLPNYLIDNACDATVPLGMITAAEAAAAKAFLKHRKSEIKSLVNANRPEFRAITQWSLT